MLKALNNYKDKQKYLKKYYGKQYQYYHLEEVKNKYGKVTEYRIVETKRKSKKLKSVNLIFTRNNGVYSGEVVMQQKV